MFAADSNNKMSSYGYQSVPNMQGTPNFGNMSNGMQQPGNITSQMMPNMMQGGFPPPMDYSAGGSLMPSMAAFAKMQAPMPPPPAPSGKNPGARFKKAPDAPKRFKSAFIIFSAEKHKEIKEHLTSQGRAEKVSRTRISLFAGVDRFNTNESYRIVSFMNCFFLASDYRYRETRFRSLARDASGRTRSMGRSSSTR